MTLPWLGLAVSLLCFAFGAFEEPRVAATAVQTKEVGLATRIGAE